MFINCQVSIHNAEDLKRVNNFISIFFSATPIQMFEKTLKKKNNFENFEFDKTLSLSSETLSLIKSTKLLNKLTNVRI